jgi:serine/threonine-protein kinase
VTALSAGNQTSCAIEQGDVYCWGDNQLGAVEPAARGGTIPSPRKIVPPKPTKATAIVVGGTFACALASEFPNDTLCWGDNAAGVIGNKQYAGTAPNAPYFQYGGLTAQLVAGSEHIATRDPAGNGKIYSRGSNWYGQMGSAIPEADQWSDYLGVIPEWTGGIASSVFAGYRNTCAIVAGEVQCIGSNQYAELGPGHEVIYTSPPSKNRVPQKVVNLRGAKKVAIGDYFMCALYVITQGDKPRVACWGHNDYFQTGQKPDVAYSNINAPADVALP